MNMRLYRDAQDRLWWQGEPAQTAVAVVPVRASPIHAPRLHVSLTGPDGREWAWIEDMDQLDPESRSALEATLHQREFRPVIQKLCRVSAFATPSTWHVETDRGACALVLKGEEDIQRLGGGRLLVTDAHGVQFLIQDLQALDRHSRKLLDRFL